MKTKYFFYLALSAFLFTACEKSGDDESKGD